MKKELKNIFTGIMVMSSAILPFELRGEELTIDYNQGFATNASEYISELEITNLSAENFYKMNIGANLAEKGCTSITNGILNWQYESTSENTSMMITNKTETTYPLFPNFPATFHYTIPTNQVVGWQTVQAEMVAPAGTVPFDYIVPITPTTTTSNGTSVAVLHGAGFNGTNTMAYFESSSVQNSDSDSMTDVQEWVAGTDKFVADGLEGVINQTTNGVEVSASPNVSERIYDIHSSTNLVEGVGFEKIGSYTNNVGETEGKFLDERDLDAASYKVEVALP